MLSLQTKAQSNYCFGNLSSFEQTSDTNVTMELDLITPVNRTWNGLLISNDPRTNSTDAFGNFGFTNVIYGKYRLSADDNTSTTWILYVGTNTIGNVPIASLITNSAAIPPNSATNYYTQAQINALLASLSSASGSNQVFWAATNILTTNARPAEILFYYPLPPYNQTNFPYWITITN